MCKSETGPGAPALALQALDMLRDLMSAVDSAQCDRVLEMIHAAHRVFVTGTGRSMLVMRCFAMRLMQAGLEVFVAGETCTPAIGEGDLLLAATGSGTTRLVLSHLEKAKAADASTACFTIFPASPAAALAGAIVCIPGATAKAERTNELHAPQIGGNSFEEGLLVLSDVMVIRLAQLYHCDVSDAAIMRRHANLE